MNETADNPPSNKLGPGIDEANLVSAIERSGYPLQTVIAETLKKSFSVTEEWGYLDRDTQEHRTLDIFAFKKLPGDNYTQPYVALLIECKRSIHPYVFFKGATDREIPNFPRFVGLPDLVRYLYGTTSSVVREVSIQRLLGLSEFEFIRPGPAHCPSFARAQVTGKKVTLSGEESFNSLILPLVKAIDQAVVLYGTVPSETQRSIAPTLILAVGVVDAPMLVVSTPNESAPPTLTPWVRVRRNEMVRQRSDTVSKYYAIDIVHGAFFETFVSQHLIGFLDRFSHRVTEQSAVLKSGGKVADLDRWIWHEVKPLG